MKVNTGTRPHRSMSSPAIVVGALGAALAAALLISSPAATQTGPPIKIGVIHDLTGALSQMGSELNEGIRLHVSEIGGQVAGRKIELLFEDSESKVDPGITKVRKLVERDRVHLVIGPVNSALAYALRDYMDTNKVPIIVTQASATDLTQAKASPYLFRTSFGSEQLNMPAAWYAYSKLGYKRAIVVALDMVGGREQSGGFIKTFRQLGGTVVSEVYAPLNTADWAPYLTRVKADLDKADFVAAIVWGPDAMRFVRGYTDYGMKGTKPILAHGSAVDEGFLPSEGAAALGILNYLFYTPTQDTPENRRFRDLTRRELGKEPTNWDAMGYTTAKVVTEALRKVQGQVEDVPRFLAALRGTEIVAPQGKFRFDEKQNAVIDLHIRRVENVGGKPVNAFVDQIPNVGQFWTPPR
ncbi:MAG: ABC transporter substrate-binding protein [Candidatus Rokubacteria bacterium]|nr:ABC transporter substrate-binding protein [Candidatus Rokubacteria bacterium]